jgi:hypothetical protein
MNEPKIAKKEQNVSEIDEDLQFMIANFDFTGDATDEVMFVPLN